MKTNEFLGKTGRKETAGLGKRERCSNQMRVELFGKVRIRWRGLLVQ